MESELVAVKSVFTLGFRLSSIGGSESGKPCIPGVFFRQFLPVSPKASSK